MIVRMFKPQFAPMVERGDKLQTVRPTPKRMPKAGDTISLREWTGKPYRSTQRVLREAVVTRTATVKIEQGAIWPNIYLDGAKLNADEELSFAMADGFPTPEALADWFETVHGLPFDGVVIYWSNDKLCREQGGKDKP